MESSRRPGVGCQGVPFMFLSCALPHLMSRGFRLSVLALKMPAGVPIRYSSDEGVKPSQVPSYLRASVFPRSRASVGMCQTHSQNSNVICAISFLFAAPMASSPCRLGRQSC